MKIWIIGRDFPTKENNMVGSVEFEQAQMLASHGYEVYYLCVDYRSFRHRRRYGVVINTTHGVNVVTLNIPIGPLCPSFMRRGLRFRLWHSLFSYFSKKNGLPSIIHVHYMSQFRYDILSFMQEKGVKIVGTEHWSKVQRMMLSDFCEGNLRNFIAKADAIICVGGALKEAIKKITDTKREIKIIPNIVPQLFTYRTVTDNSDCFRFVAVGRLSEEKGYDKLIEAFCRIMSEDANTCLSIIGGGNEYDRLKEIRIILHGLMSREKLADYYHKCNALVMPSDYETFGVPVIEAMACGVPVIVTKQAGSSCYINDTNGIVIENNEPNTIAEALLELHRRYSDYDHQSISDFAKSTFSESVVFNKVRDIYNRVIEGEVI